jgi:ABC-type Fe3+-siderophore transport system permease subunit
MTIFGREPVAWVGVIVALAIAIIQTLTGQGVLSDAVAGRAIDATNALAQVATIFIPVIIGIFATRQAVTPTAAPALPMGTTVTVYQPGVENSGIPKTV